MTLIEIIAGLVVLAVLVSAVTIARGRLLRQHARAQRKVQAADAVDRMLAGWLADGGPDDRIPVPAQGPLDAVERCTWRTTYVAADPAATRVGAAVVRLEVFEDAAPLMSVEVLKHVPPRGPRGEGR